MMNVRGHFECFITSGEINFGHDDDSLFELQISMSELVVKLSHNLEFT